jgi:hypothetical protein
MMNMAIARQRYGEHRLKAEIVDPERSPIAEQGFGKHRLPLQWIRW